ncbi:MAG: thermopsin [Thermoplasmata archaeon]
MKSVLLNRMFVLAMIIPLLISAVPLSSSSLSSSSALTVTKNPSTAIFNQVNPYSIYSKEPAPMGIADYGLGDNGVPYMYNTSSFEGILNISSLNAYNPTNSSNEISIQLNLMLEFYNLNKEYVFWVQDAALFSTGASNTGHYIQMLDNIWNESASNAMMYNSTISGNGTIGTATSVNYYYDIASSNLPGNDILTSYPLLLKLRVLATKNQIGEPELLLEYNDSYGWINYDNVVFKFARNVSDYYGFVVNGYNYTPYGSFYDAELVLGGPGNGANVEDLGANIIMQLEYWNGHNYQRIKNAYNFGSDTAETISNISDNYYSGMGICGSDLVNGNGTLKQLYSSSDIGTVSINIDLSKGTVEIDNISYFFTGQKINITLVPGNYNYTIFTSDGFEYITGNFNIIAGTNLNISASENMYNLTFFERGLKSNTLWSIILENKTYSSTSQYMTIYLGNGTYHYQIENVSGYVSDIKSGIVIIAGKNIEVNITWTVIVYNVIFREYGLTLPIKWVVELNGTKEYSLNSTIIFSEPNGSYYFSVFPIYNYITNDSAGTVVVNGQNIIIPIIWEQRVFNVSFLETGLYNSTEWYITINNQTESSNMSIILFKLPNGTYMFSVGTIAGYRPNISEGYIIVNGRAINYSIVWRIVTYHITFMEQGLPKNITWSIELDNIIKSSSSNMIVFIVSNGSYSYVIQSISGYFTENQSGRIIVAGANITYMILWNKTLYLIEFIETGLNAGTVWSVTVNNVTIYSSNSSIIFSEPEGTYNFTIHTPSGYTVSKNNGNMMVSSNTTIKLAFSKPFNLEYIFIPILILLIALIILYKKVKRKS